MLVHVDEEMKLLKEVAKIEIFLIKHVFIDLGDGVFRRNVLIIEEDKEE